MSLRRSLNLLALGAAVLSKPLFERATSAPIVGENGWSFQTVGMSGVIALEAMVVSPTLVIFFDRPANDPLMINDHPAWGALWNLETNSVTPLDLVTNTFCASGAFLSNGTMVSVGGNAVENPDTDPDQDGRMSFRLFEPCKDPAGVGCTVIDDPEHLHLTTTRWYPSAIRIFDGSIMVAGGIHERTPFYNTDPVNSFEFFPSKDGGVARDSQFLADTIPVNLFPRIFSLPDGKILMIASNKVQIYDIETNTEVALPDLPGGVRVTNPFDGTASLLPLHPPDFIPEVLVCGGTTSDPNTPAIDLSSQDPASSQCSRMTLTTEGIAKGWEVDHMLEGRIMPEMILMPNGQILITNGGQTGYAAFGGVHDAISNASNADHPAFTPSLYTPSALLGQRFSNTGMPSTNIPRMYHSSATLTPSGNILLAGSNPQAVITNLTFFSSEFRVEHLTPPFVNAARPAILTMPSKIGFNQRLELKVSVPISLFAARNVQVALMDLGFSSHAFHSSSRLVFMDATLSFDRRTLTITTPPNNRVFPPGPAFVFLTIDNVTSKGVEVMVGSGAPPPVPDQGVPL